MFPRLAGISNYHRVLRTNMNYSNFDPRIMIILSSKSLQRRTH